MSNKKMSETMQNRRKSREIALQLVYQMNSEESFNGDINEMISITSLLDGCLAEVIDYTKKIVKGVYEYEAEISDILSQYLINWRQERISMVDKAAISIAIYETMLSEDKIPVAVAVSEAVNLAKIFGTADSGRFVNGVLGTIVRGNGLTKSAE